MSLRISVPDTRWAETLADLDVDLVVWDATTPQPDGHLDLVLWPYTLQVEALAGLDVARIGVIQAQSLGYDRIADVLPAGGVYANAVGVHEAATAELAMALLLAAARGIDRFVRAQADHRWQKHWTPGLIDRRVVLIGVGGIGAELLARLTGFGADVVRVASNARDDELGHVHGTEDLGRLLPTADAVVLAVPLTASTEGLVDADFLGLLPDGAVLVNVSRGKVVVTDAVVAEAGRIVFASDVFDPEPLPADHPLWSLPNTLITPHVGGLSASMRSRVEGLVRRQIDRLRSGRDPEHVVVRSAR